MSTLPDAKTTDEVGDARSARKSGGIAALVYLVRDRGVVVSMTCGDLAVHGARAAHQAGQAGRIAARPSCRPRAARAGAGAPRDSQDRSDDEDVDVSHALDGLSSRWSVGRRRRTPTIRRRHMPG